MSINRSRKGRDPWRNKAGFTTYYDIGVQVNAVMPKNKTLEECGVALGITKQNAYTESVVALGKLCYALRQIRKAELKQ